MNIQWQDNRKERLYPSHWSWTDTVIFQTFLFTDLFPATKFSSHIPLPLTSPFTQCYNTMYVGKPNHHPTHSHKHTCLNSFWLFTFTALCAAMATRKIWVNRTQSKTCKTLIRSILLNCVEKLYETGNFIRIFFFSFFFRSAVHSIGKNQTKI